MSTLSDNNSALTKEILTESRFHTNYYDETFDSTDSSTTSQSYLSDSATSTSSEYTSPTLTETSTSIKYNTNESSYDSDESLIQRFDADSLEELRKKDYPNYIRIKCKIQQLSIKNHKKLRESNNYHINQLQKLIIRTINSGHKNDTLRTNDRPLNVKSEVINKLEATNLIQRLKTEQIEKVNNLGKNLDTSYPIIEGVSEEVYFEKKCARIRSKITEELLVKHEMFYSDGLMMIGDLAANLPKQSDDPEYIFSQLLKPLRQNSQFLAKF